MSDDSLPNQIEAAAGYEDLLVPALFQQWIERVLDAAQVWSGDRVLDVACGTGVLAREAARRVGASGSASGLDPGPGMLAVAERLAPSVDWCLGTAESLPYKDASFDAVVSQFGLMFFTDRRKALKEMLRVLTPGGRLAVAVWDSLDNIPVYAEEAATHLHLAFKAENRRQVEGFYSAPFKAGAKDNGAPGLRPQYHSNYYAAFVIGPDGHNIEVVYHEPEA